MRHRRSHSSSTTPCRRSTSPELHEWRGATLTDQALELAQSSWGENHRYLERLLLGFLYSAKKRIDPVLGLDTQKLDARACAGILKEIAPWFESGALKSSVVAARVPLTDAAAAYGRVAAGKAGKSS